MQRTKISSVIWPLIGQWHYRYGQSTIKFSRIWPYICPGRARGNGREDLALHSMYCASALSKLRVSLCPLSVWFGHSARYNCRPLQRLVLRKYMYLSKTIPCVVQRCQIIVIMDISFRHQQFLKWKLCESTLGIF